MARRALEMAGAGLFESDGAVWACANAPLGTSAATANEQAIERQILLLACM
jgi:hypothetical protein